jgi:hypothetical protein
MEQITITVNTTNAAFDPRPEWEIGRILHGLATDMIDSSVNGETISPKIIKDVNGNTVGGLVIE